MKSDLEFIARSYEALSKDVDIEFEDTITIKSRLLAEGLPFVTETMPSLARSLLRGLETGLLDAPTSFGRKGSSVLPKFLGKHFRCIFRENGELRDDNVSGQAQSVAAINQICFMWYKADFGMKADKNEATIASFVATEEDLKKTHVSLPASTLVLAQGLLTELLREFNPDLRGNYGPGICSDADQSHKHNMPVADSPASRLYQDSFFRNFEEKAERGVRMSHASLFNRGNIARVILVPKDSRGPRLISCEPTTNQWLQMSLMDSLVSHVEDHIYTCGYVNFTDQNINGLIAKSSSRLLNKATLDLKDASDRIDNELVQFLFEHTPLLKPLMASRTPQTQLPDGRVITLRKFAPMGSAMCFPTMALVIWAVCNAHLSILRNEFRTDYVYVYGDDIITDVENFSAVCAALTQSKLRVNVNKSFVRGRFRESCGIDAYNGVCVTPKKIKNPPVFSGELSVNENLFRLITLRNSFSGFTHFQEFLESTANSLLPKKKSIAYVGNHSNVGFQVSQFDERLNDPRNFKRVVVKKRPLEGTKVMSELTVLNVALKRVGQFTQNGVLDIDLRQCRYSLAKVRDSDRRSSFDIV